MPERLVTFSAAGIAVSGQRVQIALAGSEMKKYLRYGRVVVVNDLRMITLCDQAQQKKNMAK